MHSMDGAATTILLSAIECFGDLQWARHDVAMADVAMGLCTRGEDMSMNGGLTFLMALGFSGTLNEAFWSRLCTGGTCIAEWGWVYRYRVPARQIR